jgi:probable HAF family extracellular repeat protein
MAKTMLAFFCCLLTSGYAAPAASKAFHEIPVSLDFYPEISADGLVAVGNGLFPDPSGTPYRWTLTPSGLTMEALAIVGFSPLSAVDGDGSLIVGTNALGAFRWTDAGGIQSLGVPFSLATGVSTDGAVVVGSSGGEAFQWTEWLGFQPLGFLRGDVSSGATAVAGDGGVVVGWSRGSSPTPGGGIPLRAFRWTPAVGMRDLGGLPGQEGAGQALGISSGGDVIVGQFADEAFRWSEAEGMLGLGFLPGGTRSLATDVSRDGSRVVGWGQEGKSNRSAFLWTPEAGMRSLDDVLGVDEGLDLGGLHLTRALSISDDGQVITGMGIRGYERAGWVVDLREIQPPDAYQCYDLKTSKGAAKFEARDVSLSDVFGDAIQTVKKGKRLCAPAEVDGVAVADSEAQLLCYDISKTSGWEPFEVRVNNPFGEDQILTVKEPKRLCVPSTTEQVDSKVAPGDPEGLELDHFQCYGVVIPKYLLRFDPVEVALSDPFRDWDRLVKKPSSLCTPVDKNGEGILGPENHLTCYEVKSLEVRSARRRLNLDVLARNQFGEEQLFTVKRPKTLCVPSEMERVDDRPAACSAIEDGEFGPCRAIIGWGISSRTGLCAPVSGCGCDERCDGRVFEDESTCLQECGGERNRHR